MASSQCIAIIVAILGITLTSTLALPDSHHNLTTPNPACSNETQTKLHARIRENFQCYNNIISFYLGNTSVSGCTKTDDLKPIMKSILNNTCVKNPKKYNATLNIFYNLVNFTTSDNKFKDFIVANGTTCINKTRSEIMKCVKDATGAQKFNRTTDFIHLNLKVDAANAGCPELQSIKQCVQKEMEKEHACQKRSIEFFTCLADFVHKKVCSKVDPKKPNTASIISPQYIFAVITAIALL